MLLVVYAFLLASILGVDASYPSAEEEAQLSDLVERLLLEWHTPGLAIAIIDGNRTWEKGYGLATLPSTRVTPRSLFYMGSTTKSFTAAAISILIDKQPTGIPCMNTTMSWTTPISQILREDFVLSDQWATDHITIEDALSHRTGYPGHDFAWQNTSQEFVRAFRHLPMSSEPRTKYTYNNQMFTTLGYLLEVVTRRNLKEIFSDWLWKPLNMNETVLSLQDAKEIGRLAKGYWWSDKTQTYVPLPYSDIPQVQGAGMVISSVHDYAKYLHSMIQKSPPISPAGHKELTTPRIITEPDGAPLFQGPRWYALGWEAGVFQGEVLNMHLGIIDGFNTVMAFSPQRKVGVVVTVNAVISVQEIVFWETMYGLFGVKKRARVDVEKLAKERVEKTNQFINNARSILYPKLPSPPVQRPLPVKVYTGTYNHLAYHNLTFHLCDSSFEPSPLQRPANPRYIASPSCELKTDPFHMIGIQWHLEVEHVSGESWLGLLYIDNHDPEVKVAPVKVTTDIEDGSDEVRRISVEFDTGVNIWFDKIEG